MTVSYKTPTMIADIVAGIIVGVLVIPQSLGYAVLAGLPPVYGLYAAIVPVFVYALVGTSPVLAVGPVAITAIMTASTLSSYTQYGSAVYASMAGLLAVLVGCILWLAGRLKLGWITQFISRGVASGFISGAAVLIVISQLSYVTAIDIHSENIFSALQSLWFNYKQLHLPTLTVGSICFIIFAINKYANLWQSSLFTKLLPKLQSTWIERLLPLLLVFVVIYISGNGNWQEAGIHVVGTIPSGLPQPSLLQIPSFKDLLHLLPAASLMALIVFISSDSISSHYARVRGDCLDANRELKALGLANIGGGFSQSFTVAGGFSRTAINVDSGAQTTFASIVSTVVMLVVLLYFTQLFAPLPYALLGAMIISSIISLVDYKLFLYAWQVDRVDAISLLVTFWAVLIFGLNVGLVIGLLVSFGGLVWQSSQPHIAIVGRIEGTAHFRNIRRHNVKTFDTLLLIRVDESLFFANSQAVYKQIHNAIRAYPKAVDIVLIMSSVNYIDLAAQEMLVTLNNDISSANQCLHYTFIKGPVMDVIEQTEVIKALSGEVFLNTISAVVALDKNQQ